MVDEVFDPDASELPAKIQKNAACILLFVWAELFLGLRTARAHAHTHILTRSNMQRAPLPISFTNSGPHLD